MKLLPILKTEEQNAAFSTTPACRETLNMTLDFYKRVGFEPPWICFYAELNGALVGSAGYKGKPVNGSVEIAYGTFEHHRQKGIGSMICKALVDLALTSDPGIKITARTLPEKNYSTRILEKNNFRWLGVITDPEDGEVWEWEYKSF
jgi:[ribosomal protein S5]-alanine N-acetyltransferase